MSGERFHWADFVVFVLTLLLSLAIGIFYALREKKVKDDNRTSNFLVAGRQMSVLPVAVSLFVSWMSSISILGKFVIFVCLLVAIWASRLPSDDGTAIHRWKCSHAQKMSFICPNVAQKTSNTRMIAYVLTTQTF